MSESTIRREFLRKLALQRGYSVGPRYLCWRGTWYDVRSGKPCVGNPNETTPKGK